MFASTWTEQLNIAWFHCLTLQRINYKWTDTTHNQLSFVSIIILNITLLPNEQYLKTKILCNQNTAYYRGFHISGPPNKKYSYFPCSALHNFQYIMKISFEYSIYYKMMCRNWGYNNGATLIMKHSSFRYYWLDPSLIAVLILSICSAKGIHLQAALCNNAYHLQTVNNALKNKWIRPLILS